MAEAGLIPRRPVASSDPPPVAPRPRADGPGPDDIADPVAFADLVRRHQQRLYNAVARLVGHADDAAEITQEAFARAWERADTFAQRSSAYTWLFRIAMNLAVSHLRTRSRRPGGTPGSQASGGSSGSNGSVSAAASPQAGPLERLTASERDGVVAAALAGVDDVSRTLLVMRDVDGLEYAVMADLLGLPLGTVKSRLFRARLALRDELQRRGLL